MTKRVTLWVLALLLCFALTAQAEDMLDDVPWLMDSLFTELRTDLLLLASEAEPLSADYVPPRLMELPRRTSSDGSGFLYAASTGRLLLCEEATEALLQMVTAAERDGIVLYVRQAYRSWAEENELNQRLIAQGLKGTDPSCSDWRTGLAVALVGKNWRGLPLSEEFGGTEEAQWLASHCYDYGFVLRYPRFHEEETGHAWEPWHLRFVGRDAADLMRLNGQCLEEFRTVNKDIW